MFVRRLGLRDFRSWSAVDVDLSPGATVFVGRNGHGKTNLLEALMLLSTGASHRVSTDAPLLRTGHTEARIEASVVHRGRELDLRLDIRDRRVNLAAIGGAPRRPRDVVGILSTVLFAPEDLALVRGEPAERRRFVDELATLRRPVLAGVRSDYDRVLRQRTALLKTAGAAVRPGGVADVPALSTLDAWDTQLARLGAELVVARVRLLEELAPRLTAAYAGLAPESHPLTMHYRSAAPIPGLPGGVPRPVAGGDGVVAGDPGILEDPEYIEMCLLAALAARRREELARGQCVVGPHRDDLVLLFGDRPAKGYASHGETWSTALALRIASFELLSAGGAEPVLLLDDVFAELDRRRREHLADMAEGVEQVLLTAAVAEDVPERLGARRLRVEMIEDAGKRVSRLGSAPGVSSEDGVPDEANRVGGEITDTETARDREEGDYGDEP